MIATSLDRRRGRRRPCRTRRARAARRSGTPPTGCRSIEGDADAADRPGERQPGELGGRGRGVDRDDVVGVLRVQRHHRDDDLDLVAQAVDERRAQRPVDQPAGEDRVGARAALAAEERAGDPARGVHALLDVDRQREEVEVLLGVLRRRGGRQQHGLVVEVGDDGAGGLAGQPPGLEPDGAGAEAPVVDHGGGLVHRVVGEWEWVRSCGRASPRIGCHAARDPARPVFDRSARVRAILRSREPLPRTGGWSSGDVARVVVRAGAGSPRAASSGPGGSAAQAEALDQRPVARDVDLRQVLQQPPAAADHEQQATTRVVVVLVLLEVLGQVADPLGQQRDLRLGRTGVALVDPVGVQDGLLLCGVECHGLGLLASLCREADAMGDRVRKTVAAATDCSRTRCSTLPGAIRTGPGAPDPGAAARAAPSAAAPPGATPRPARGRPGASAAAAAASRAGAATARKAARPARPAAAGGCGAASRGDVPLPAGPARPRRAAPRPRPAGATAARCAALVEHQQPGEHGRIADLDAARTHQLAQHRRAHARSPAPAGPG